jgi:prepilin-type N-terminal cleavage/methylation domain-containing protein
MKKLHKSGFTIIELLIATVVFSVVLLIVTTGIVQFGRIYYKGVIQSRTQERARAIVEDISQNLQFSGTNLSGNQVVNPGYICAGNRVYTYTKYQKLSSNQRVLVAQSGAPCAMYTPMQSGSPLPALLTNATELAGDNMILLDLSVTQQTSDIFQVHIRLAYAGSTTDLTSLTPTGTCKGLKVGGQFCAISELTTTVSRRLK